MSHRDTKISLAKLALECGRILTIKTTYYGRGATITAGPYKTATGEWGGYGVFRFMDRNAPGYAEQTGLTAHEAATWVAEWTASTSHLRDAIRRSEGKVEA